MFFRPRKMRWCCWAVAGLIVAVAGVAALTLKSSKTGVSFGAVDQIAIFALGVLAGVGVLRLTRPAVWADNDTIRIRSFFSERTFSWAQVTALRFRSGAYWGSVELANSEVIPLIAIQAIDGEAAAIAMTTLREFHSAAQATVAESHVPENSSSDSVVSQSDATE